MSKRHTALLADTVASRAAVDNYQQQEQRRWCRQEGSRGRVTSARRVHGLPVSLAIFALKRYLADLVARPRPALLLTNTRL